MGSIIRLIRDRVKGVPQDIPLDYSPITENLYIAAWPTKQHVVTIKRLNVELIISAILETPDKELGQEPLSLVRVRATDLHALVVFPTGQLLKGVRAALPVLHRGGTVMVFCKAGVHRSPTLATCILIALGHSREQAMAIVKEGRSQADFSPSVRRLIENFEHSWQEHQGADRET